MFCTFITQKILEKLNVNINSQKHKQLYLITLKVKINQKYDWADIAISTSIRYRLIR